MDLALLLRWLITQKGKQIRKQWDRCSDREMTTSKLLNIPELQLHHLWHETKNPCWRWEVKWCTYDQNKHTQKTSSHVLFPTLQNEEQPTKEENIWPRNKKFQPKRKVQGRPRLAGTGPERPPVQVGASGKASTRLLWKDKTDKMPHVFENI